MILSPHTCTYNNISSMHFVIEPALKHSLEPLYLGCVTSKSCHVASHAPQFLVPPPRPMCNESSIPYCHSLARCNAPSVDGVTTFAGGRWITVCSSNTHTHTPSSLEHERDEYVVVPTETTGTGTSSCSTCPYLVP